MPDGPGREMVQATCSKCHGLNLISGSWGNTDEGWHELFGSMVTLPKDQADTIAAYLATNFPPKPAPEAVVIAGPATVSFKEWLVPTLGSRPHDPLAAADGSLWWTGQFARQARPARSGVGRDEGVPAAKRALRTARAGRGSRRQHLVHREFAAPTSASSIRRPATLPSTRCRRPSARGPHTPIFDQKGTLLFTRAVRPRRPAESRDRRDQGVDDAGRRHAIRTASR